MKRRREKRETVSSELNLTSFFVYHLTDQLDFGRFYKVLKKPGILTFFDSQNIREIVASFTFLSKILIINQYLTDNFE